METRVLATALGIVLASIATATPVAAGSVEPADWRKTCAELGASRAELEREADRSPYSKVDYSRFLDPPGGAPWATALLVHGLNSRPSKMEAVAGILLRAGLRVVRVGLSGHRGDPAELGAVTGDAWLGETYRAYCAARAQDPGLPVYYVGYSLGGVIGETLLNEPTGDRVRFRRVVLLAPALEIRETSNWIRYAFGFGDGFRVPSFTDRAYRANDGMSVAGYKALFDLQARLRASGYARSRVPTLVMMEPRDELVSYAKIAATIRERGLTGWTLDPVSTADSPLLFPYHHLVVKPETFGNREWTRIEERITDFLRAE